MVNGIAVISVFFLVLKFFISDTVNLRHIVYFCWCAPHTFQIFAEILDISADGLRCVVARVQGHKNGSDLLSLGTERVERSRHHLQFGRANVGTMGESEEDQHVLSAEIAVSDRLAVLIDESEFTS